MTTTEMVAGRTLDAEIATKVMGVDLTVPRTYALARVGSMRIDWTGHVFRLDTGDDVPMPSNLTVLSTDRDGNDRYYRYVAEWLIEHGHTDVSAAVDAWRTEPEKYSSSIGAAWLVVERMRELGYWLECGDVRDRGCNLRYARFGKRDGLWRDRITGQAPDYALAICRAALAAVAS